MLGLAVNPRVTTAWGTPLSRDSDGTRGGQRWSRGGSRLQEVVRACVACGLGCANGNPRVSEP